MKTTPEVEAAYKAALKVTYKHGANDKEKTEETRKALGEAQMELVTVIGGFEKSQIMQLAGYMVYKACFSGVSITSNTWDLKKSEPLLNVFYSVINAVKGTRKDDDCRKLVTELHARRTTAVGFLRLSSRIGYRPEYGMTPRALEEALEMADKDIKLRGADDQTDENREVAIQIRDMAAPLRNVLRGMQNAQKNRANKQPTWQPQQPQNTTLGDALPEGTAKLMQKSVGGRPSRKSKGGQRP